MVSIYLIRKGWCLFIVFSHLLSIHWNSQWTNITKQFQFNSKRSRPLFLMSSFSLFFCTVPTDIVASYLFFTLYFIFFNFLLFPLFLLLKIFLLFSDSFSFPFFLWFSYYITEPGFSVGFKSSKLSLFKSRSISRSTVNLHNCYFVPFDQFSPIA